MPDPTYLTTFFVTISQTDATQKVNASTTTSSLPGIRFTVKLIITNPLNQGHNRKTTIMTKKDFFPTGPVTSLLQQKCWVPKCLL